VPQHAEAVLECPDHIVELGRIVGCGDHTPGMAVEIDAVDHHHQAQLVDKARLAASGDARRRLLRSNRVWVIASPAAV
jgi:hypothetical protein